MTHTLVVSTQTATSLAHQLKVSALATTVKTRISVGQMPCLHVCQSNLRNTSGHGCMMSQRLFQHIIMPHTLCNNHVITKNAFKV